VTKVVEIRLVGFKEALDRLKEFGPNVTKNGLRSSTFAGAKVIRDEVKATAPVRTGLLRESVSTFRRKTPEYQARYSIGFRHLLARYANTRENRRKNRVGKRYRLANPAFYAHFLEFGTSKMRAHPFMRPAALRASDRALAAMGANLAKAIDRAARKARGR